MPHPPLYSWSQDDDRTRSIDVVHIEPSIREGVHLVSSLYGREASSPLYRFPPVSSDNAWIRGDAVIPSLLTAEEGTWNASPSAYFEYQWMANGVDIPFATNKTWMSTVDYDGQTITVEIRGINYMGQDITISSGLGISILEPIEVWEQEDYIITGMPQGIAAQTTRDERTLIVSGLGTTDRIDVNRGVAYFLTGMAADDRFDANAMNFCMIQGISAEDRMDVIERDWGISVINYPYEDALVESVPKLMNLKNPGAELGTFGWQIFGTVQAVSDDVRSGYYSWNGGDNVGPSGANTPYSYMWQDVPISEAWFADVDANLTNLEVYWYQFSEETQDMANCRVQFYDVNGVMIGFDDGPGLWASPNDIWFYRQFETPIPAGTRSVRIFGEFNLQAGDNNDAGIDEMWLYIRKGAKVNARDYGPSFNQWRVRFIQANTWSGTGLSELEFRASSGGADLAIGGSPIFGSAGLGVANADFAFDDLRNTGYWAGEENGVANDTAWIGYNMGIPVRPQAIDFTARTGSNSLQVGKEFYLEASDDGIRWTKVQYVPASRMGGNFASGEQREILTPSGPYDFFRLSGGNNYLYSRDQFSGDDFAGKACIFEAHTRMNIDELSVVIDDSTQAGPFNYRLQLFRLNNQKGSLYQPGMVTEVLENIQMSSPGTSSGIIWQTAACSQSWEFEVGDWFMVRFYDEDAATNPIDPFEGRTRWISSYNGQLDPYTLRNGVAQRIGVWQGDVRDLVIGDANPTGFIGGGIGAYWAVDFKGSIF